MLELPKYLDVLLILDKGTTRSRICRLLSRSKDYLTNALNYLVAHELITIQKGTDDERTIIITLTDKGHDAQEMIIQLYNIMGLKIWKN